MLTRGAQTREDYLAIEGRPFSWSDWMDAVFMHYRVPTTALQPHIPYPLHTFDGSAWVSLVAFRFKNYRPFKSPGWLGKLPFSNADFLNVRTYVELEGQPGIHFITEWQSDRLNTVVGPLLYMLPLRAGVLNYTFDLDQREVYGSVRAETSDHALRYRATVPDDVELTTSAPGSVDAFLLERYVAFLAQGRRRGYFRVSHDPWEQTRIDVDIEQDNLIHCAGSWAHRAEFSHANLTPGTRDVWISRPHRLKELRRPEPEILPARA